VKASGTNQRFSHSATTTASPARIWEIWMDVPNWKLWDKGLQDATSTNPLMLGSNGHILAQTGSRVPFLVTEFQDQTSYTFETALPLAKLYVRRSIISTGPTLFRHEVWFDGPMAFAWGFALGRGFRTALPLTMAALVAIAEKQGQGS
jgi:hypothetical protein